MSVNRCAIENTLARTGLVIPSSVRLRRPREESHIAPHDSYLVDPASSHMLVSKIKPCMSKHIPLYGEAANGSLGHP